jgi:hypothetical protein
VAIAFISHEVVQSTAQNSTQAMTVPAGCDFVVWVGGGWNSADIWASGTPTISLGGVAMTLFAGSVNICALAYLAAPLTGSRTLSWNWNAAGTEGVNGALLYFSGVDQTTPVADSGSANNTSVTGLTAADAIVGIINTFTDATTTATNNGQTEVISNSTFNDARIAVAYKIAAETSWSATHTGEFKACMAITLNESEASADELLANDVASASSVTSPALGQIHALTANDVASASSVSATALTQIHALTADDVVSASNVSVPALTQAHALSADDVSSASSVTEPAVTDVPSTVNNLLAEDVASASSVSDPDVGQVHALGAEGVVSASSVSEPVLSTDVHHIQAEDVVAESSVGTLILGQLHVLLANDIIAASSVSAPDMASGSSHSYGVVIG